MLPPVDGLRCLDLGCGEGHHTRLLANRGAEVVALDIAKAYIDAAAGEVHRGIRYVVGDGSILPFPAASFDVVTAFMSLMDGGDPERTLSEMARVLRRGGFAPFSVVHPTTSTPIRRWVDDESGVRHALAIGDYFYEGPVTETWIFGAAPSEVRDRHRPFTITYARRTLSSWLNAVLNAGLSIDPSTSLSRRGNRRGAPGGSGHADRAVLPPGPSSQAVTARPRRVGGVADMKGRRGD
jgi:SAM-dependent methyltransferase